MGPAAIGCAVAHAERANAANGLGQRSFERQRKVEFEANGEPCKVLDPRLAPRLPLPAGCALRSDLIGMHA